MFINVIRGPIIDTNLRVARPLVLKKDHGTGIDTVTVVSPTGASTQAHNSYIPFLHQREEASAGGCLGTSMASNGLNLAELRGLVTCLVY